MTNRARPTWPEGAAESSKSQRPSQGGSPSTPPANATSNGRSSSGDGQQRAGAPNREFRPNRDRDLPVRRVPDSPVRRSPGRSSRRRARAPSPELARQVR